MKTKTRPLTIPYEKEKRWFFVAVSLCLVAGGAYIYFLSASVVHVVLRQEVGRDIATLQKEISLLEAEYITAQHTLSEEVATQKGFVTVVDKSYIDVSEPTLVLSRN
jgi:hypothetical protein